LNLLLLLPGGPGERDGRSCALCQSSGSPCTAMTPRTGTCRGKLAMSALGGKRTSPMDSVMSAF